MKRLSTGDGFVSNDGHVTVIRQPFGALDVLTSETPWERLSGEARRMHDGPRDAYREGYVMLAREAFDNLFTAVVDREEQTAHYWVDALATYRDNLTAMFGAEAPEPIFREALSNDPLAGSSDPAEKET